MPTTKQNNPKQSALAKKSPQKPQSNAQNRKIFNARSHKNF
jgi:hypothetical protein